MVYPYESHILHTSKMSSHRIKMLKNLKSKNKTSKVKTPIIETPKVEFPKTKNTKFTMSDYYLLGILGCGIVGMFAFSYVCVTEQKRKKYIQYDELMMMSGCGLLTGLFVGVTSPILVPLAIPPLLCYGVSSFKVSRE